MLTTKASWNRIEYAYEYGMHVSPNNDRNFDNITVTETEQLPYV